MPYPKFDRSRLNIKPLDKRVHDLELDDFMLPLDAPVPEFEDPNLPELAQRMLVARRNDRPVILMMGAHVIRKGMSQMIIDLMERGILAKETHEQVIRFAPPLVISQEELEWALPAIEEVVQGAGVELAGV